MLLLLLLLFVQGGKDGEGKIGQERTGGGGGRSSNVYSGEEASNERPETRDHTVWRSTDVRRLPNYRRQECRSITTKRRRASLVCERINTSSSLFCWRSGEQESTRWTVGCGPLCRITGTANNESEITEDSHRDRDHFGTSILSFSLLLVGNLYGKYYIVRAKVR